MQLFGLVTFGYMWARMAKVAQDKIAGSGATPYLTTKLVTGRFFMERMLPETARASCAHPDRLRDHHGIGGGSVLRLSAVAPPDRAIILRSSYSGGRHA